MNHNDKKAGCKKRVAGKFCLKTILVIASIFILTITLTFIFHSPRVDDQPHFSTDGNRGDHSDFETSSPVYERKEGFYTFLIAGIDAVSNNTDVLILASLDTKNGKIEHFGFDDR